VSRYRAVLFDFDNTLVDYSAAEEEALRLALSGCGILRGEEDWLAFRACFEPASLHYWLKRDAYTAEEMTYLTFRDALRQFTGRDDAARKLADLYWERFCSLCRFEPGARDVLDHLSGRYRLGIVTNGLAAAQRRRLAACGIAGRFQAVVISDEVGCRKPDPRVFEIALDLLGVRPAETLFVGDSVSDDYEGAKNAGIPFCFYNRKKIALDDGFRPDHVIESLEQLKAIVP
jgi:HAD superfamily hydrolase (TIGR01509 family)